MSLLDRLRAVFGTPYPLPVMLMTLGVSWLAEAAIVWIGDGPHTPWTLVGIGLAAAILGLVLADRWWRPRPFALERMTGEAARPTRWLVVSASLGEGIRSAVAAARHHRDVGAGRFARVVVLHTDDEAGRGARDALCRALEEEVGLRESAGAIVRRAVDPEGVDDPERVYAALQQVSQEALEAGLTEDDLVFDYTGGSKAFTAAMVLAGAPGERRLEYVRPLSRGPDGRPAPGAGLRVMEIDLRYDVSPVRR